jgi:very-short-patch-repair endonuclease
MLRNRAYYQLEYVEKERSIYDIAREHNTYPNKIRREILACGYTLRDKSAAQKAAIRSGRHKHPTKGTERPLDVRLKISASMSAAWGKMSSDERRRRIEIGRANWHAIPEERREAFRRMAAVAVRETSEYGSRLERFIRDSLSGAGHVVRQRVKPVDTVKPVDIYLVNLGIVIDIDGPFHFMPIWGEKALERQRKTDEEKIDAILAKGLVMIRVIYMATMSATQQEALLNYILGAIDNIRTNFPESGDRLIEIEVK